MLAGRGLIGVEHLPPNFGEPGYGPRVTPSAVPEPAGGVSLMGHGSRVDENSVTVEVGTTVDEAERQLILKTLNSTHNNKTRAAEILGITTKTLQNKLKEYASAAASGSTSGSASIPDPAAIGAE